MLETFETTDEVSYEYTTRKVKVENKYYEAHYPKDHTRIKAVVLEIKDKNYDPYDPGWSTIRDWRISLYVKWKDKNKWECIYEDQKYYRDHNCYKFVINNGIDDLLFSMETEERKGKLWKRHHILELRDLIKKYKKELITLEKGV